ncbi:hypothetical protein SDC9_191175 [bioreactor metagenome]|uniref:Uncharacterized protein n=1 Tax=bioreactor metagenome TaxID=1076179 RepID=A0A645HX51_9ZZZZ
MVAMLSKMEYCRVAAIMPVMIPIIVASPMLSTARVRVVGSLSTISCVTDLRVV